MPEARSRPDVRGWVLFRRVRSSGKTEGLCTVRGLQVRERLGGVNASEPSLMPRHGYIPGECWTGVNRDRPLEPGTRAPALPPGVPSLREADERFRWTLYGPVMRC